MKATTKRKPSRKAMQAMREHANSLPPGQTRAMLHYGANEIENLLAALVVSDLAIDELSSSDQTKEEGK